MSRLNRGFSVCALPLALQLGSCATTSPSPSQPGATHEPSSPDRTTGAPAGLPVLPGAGSPEAVTPTSGTVSFESLEGPFWVARDGGYLLFSDVVEANGPGAKIYRFDPRPRRFSVLAYPAAAPTSTNGLAVDDHGALFACERYNARVVRVDGAGHSSVLADRWPVDPTAKTAALPLNAPNDLAVRGDGNLYFTDSDWGARPGPRRAAMGVYRVDPAGALSRILELEKPNGIALSPDGASLYVGSDTQAKVWRLPLDAQGTPGIPTLLIDASRVPGGFKVPDGICIDDAGDLYVTNNDDAMKAILVFDSTGRAKAKLPFPERRRTARLAATTARRCTSRPCTPSTPSACPDPACPSAPRSK